MGWYREGLGGTGWRGVGRGRVGQDGVGWDGAGWGGTGWGGMGWSGSDRDGAERGGADWTMRGGALTEHVGDLALLSVEHVAAREEVVRRLRREPRQLLETRAQQRLRRAATMARFSTASFWPRPICGPKGTRTRKLSSPIGWQHARTNHETGFLALVPSGPQIERGLTQMDQICIT